MRRRRPQKPPNQGGFFRKIGSNREDGPHNGRRKGRFAGCMKILTLTTLYPNSAAPAHGVFVENRLAAWIARSGGGADVIAPVPWFPFTHETFGRYARYAAAPAVETRRGVDVFHPRYLIAPKIGMTAAPAALADAFERQARALIAAGRDFDLIDAHYLYPDGVAAIEVGQRLGKPVILTARGSDVTLLPDYAKPRMLILDAVRRAAGVVAVSASLKSDLVALGAPAEKIAVLRNGVDLDVFRPLDREAIRLRMGLAGIVYASVGSLIARKGHDVAIRATAITPGATLLVIGDGEERAALEALARDLGAADRIRFLGAVAHEALAEIYSAADALVLASTREGWPNVLLESMACGTPAVASDAGGNREVIRTKDAGRIVTSREGADFAAALAETVKTSNREATRRFAAAHGWDETSDGLTALYAETIAGARLARRLQFSPVKTPPSKPKLIVTVDTEEIFNWNAFTDENHRIADPEDIDRFQTLCDAFDIRPLYFITAPLIASPKTASYFKALADSGRAFLGIHLHQWNTPPMSGFKGEYYSWQCNLPAALHAAKLQSLSDAFTAAFGARPTAHRAGRYGVRAPCYVDLAAIGVTHDFSPSPAFDFSAAGGPDFSGASNNPFRVATPDGDVVVTPVCGARALRGGRAFLAQPGGAGLGNARPPLSRRLTAPFRLSCEQARLSELISLTRRLEKTQTPIATFSLHSTTMTPGANSYAPDARAVDAALDLTRRYFEFFTKDFRGDCLDYPGLAKFYADCR